jgi:predicted carbohydrate-binding protein with CBM5 and CBM33 domain
VKTLRRMVATLAVGVLAAGGFLVTTASPASAHGVTLIPGARTYLCWLDGIQSNGQIIPSNPACRDAVAQSGDTPLYNWFAVLDSNAAGRTVGYVPDGTICSAGNRSPYNFAPYNMARTDWPATRLTSGGSIRMRHSNWAHHPGRFDLYITRNGWNQTRPLAWSDLEPTPFFSITNPPQVGGPGTVEGYYDFGVVGLPGGKTGRHLILAHWIRADSNENFYSCSDVIFDGGNGELVGVRQGNTSPPPSSPPPSSPPPSSPPPSSPPGPGGCAVAATVQTQWGNGYVIQPVTVTNSGSTTITGWSVTFTMPAGHSVTGQWNATFSPSGQTITARNFGYNGTLAPGQSTSFGFQASRPNGNTATPTGYACSTG